MIKRAKAKDAEILATLAIQMWTEHNLEEMTDEFRELLKNDEAVCFIKYEGEKPIESYVSGRIFRLWKI